jgi:hypothetical protein
MVRNPSIGNFRPAISTMPSADIKPRAPSMTSPSMVITLSLLCTPAQDKKSKHNARKEALNFQQITESCLP